MATVLRAVAVRDIPPKLQTPAKQEDAVQLKLCLPFLLRTPFEDFSWLLYPKWGSKRRLIAQGANSTAVFRSILIFIFSLTIGGRKNVQSYLCSHMLHFKVWAETNCLKLTSFPSCYIHHWLFWETVGCVYLYLVLDTSEWNSSFLIFLQKSFFFFFF